MKRSLFTVGLVSLSLMSSVAFAQDDVDLDDVTMDVVEENELPPQRVMFPVRDIVLEYMLENGDITQEEINTLNTQRAELREEIKAAKESGDTETLAALKEEMRALRQERRESVKEYLEENQELKDEVKAALEELREERQQRREELRERRRQFREENSADETNE